jgi:hypothetical protein
VAESTLSISLSDLRIEVSRYLGYPKVYANLSASQSADVDGMVNSGTRQFYFPPASEIIDPSFEWSFMRPTATLDTVADQSDYDMEDDFGHIVGEIFYDSDNLQNPIKIVSVGVLLELRSDRDDTGRPRVAALNWKASDGSDGQRQELLLYPTPDAAYTLTYRYEAYSGQLTESLPYALGGMKHSETLISSCIAVAEQRINGEKGVQSEAFLRNLATSVERDRKSGAQVFGNMGDHGGRSGYGDRYDCRFGSSNYEITYKGDTW